MKISKFTKAVTVILVLGAIFTAAFSILPTREDEELYSKVVRLHVLANSNTEDDQALKLKVRDAIIKHSKNYETPKSTDEACLLYESKKDELEGVAEDVMRAEGYELSATVELTWEFYPTKVYEDIALPAGEYISLKVMLGEAKGQNWWCVLYPPICLSVASAKPQNDKSNEEKLIEAGFTPGQINIVSEDKEPVYKLKFKILEDVKTFWNKIFG